MRLKKGLNNRFYLLLRKRSPLAADHFDNWFSDYLTTTGWTHFLNGSELSYDDFWSLPYHLQLGLWYAYCAKHRTLLGPLSIGTGFDLAFCMTYKLANLQTRFTTPKKRT